MESAATLSFEESHSWCLDSNEPSFAFSFSECRDQMSDCRFLLCVWQVWVDSDGKVANNGPRMAGLSDPRGNSADGPASAGALLDHQWHMLTVSTQPDHVKGFRCAQPLLQQA